MKKAIVTGATGFIGRALVRLLSHQRIEVLGLGRQKLSRTEITQMLGSSVTYEALDNDSISSLEERLSNIDWRPGDDCVFFHLAWDGLARLADGDLPIQLRNAVQGSEAVRAAKQVGCVKFVNSGSMEETFLERAGALKDHSFQSDQFNYAVAKLASRDSCKMVAYLEKIDYVHTRFSVPIAANLEGESYVSSTLRAILNKQPWSPPRNPQLFNFIRIEDLADALCAVGSRGKNGRDYVVCGQETNTLSGFFNDFEAILDGKDHHVREMKTEIGGELFNTSALTADTGFEPRNSCLDLARNGGDS